MTQARIEVRVQREHDIMEACRQARQLAEMLGFDRVNAYHIATAASEMAANVLRHGGGGTLVAAALDIPPGLELLANDQGPGIANLELAMCDGYSSAGGLGCGLPGVKRLMDELEIHSAPHQGTWVRAVKWRERPPR